MNYTEGKLQEINSLVEQGANAENTLKILDMIGAGGLNEQWLSEFRLWGDYLPVGLENPYTEEERNLHILWETIDRVALGINIAFAVPFRQIIAKKLFKACGDGFVANEGCRFNYGNRIEVGKNVSWNHGCYVDAKGGVKFGDFAIMTEYTKIFTHGHSEDDHEERSYAPVVIGDYAKIYTNSTILPGVTIGKGAIVATGAIVTKNVDEFTLVGGIPAKPMRPRKTDKLDFVGLNHYMFSNKAFQDK